MPSTPPSAPDLSDTGPPLDNRASLDAGRTHPEAMLETLLRKTDGWRETSERSVLTWLFPGGRHPSADRSDLLAEAVERRRGRPLRLAEIDARVAGDTDRAVAYLVAALLHDPDFARRIAQRLRRASDYAIMRCMLVLARLRGSIPGLGKVLLDYGPPGAGYLHELLARRDEPPSSPPAAAGPGVAAVARALADFGQSMELGDPADRTRAVAWLEGLNPDAVWTWEAARNVLAARVLLGGAAPSNEDITRLYPPGPPNVIELREKVFLDVVMRDYERHPRDAWLKDWVRAGLHALRRRVPTAPWLGSGLRAVLGVEAFVRDPGVQAELAALPVEYIVTIPQVAPPFPAEVVTEWIFTLCDADPSTWPRRAVKVPEGFEACLAASRSRARPGIADPLERISGEFLARAPARFRHLLHAGLLFPETSA